MSSQSTTRPRRLPLAKRQALVLEALPTIQRMAAHLASVYQSPRLEADDLAQIAALACLEALARGIKASGNKVAYLVVVGRHAMQRYCGQHTSLITTPRKTNGYQPALVVVSLEAPRSDGSGQTLADVLADESEEDESCGQDDYDAAYDAYLDSLPGEGGQS